MVIVTRDAIKVGGSKINGVEAAVLIDHAAILNGASRQR